MIDFIELFNAVARVAKPAHPDFNNAKAMSDKMAEINIDSLDSILITIFFCELYGIDPDLSKEWVFKTIQEFYDLVIANKTTEPASVEEAIKVIK